MCYRLSCRYNCARRQYYHILLLHILNYCLIKTLPYCCVCVCVYCSILGMHLFGCKFGLRQDSGDTLPDRKNFDSLLWATVTVFQVRQTSSHAPSLGDTHAQSTQRHRRYLIWRNFPINYAPLFRVRFKQQLLQSRALAHYFICSNLGVRALGFSAKYKKTVPVGR